MVTAVSRTPHARSAAAALLLIRRSCEGRNGRSATTTRSSSVARRAERARSALQRREADMLTGTWRSVGTRRACGRIAQHLRVPNARIEKGGGKGSRSRVPGGNWHTRTGFSLTLPPPSNPWSSSGPAHLRIHVDRRHQTAESVGGCGPVWCRMQGCSATGSSAPRSGSMSGCSR